MKKLKQRLDDMSKKQQFMVFLFLFMILIGLAFFAYTDYQTRTDSQQNTANDNELDNFIKEHEGGVELENHSNKNSNNTISVLNQSSDNG